MTDAEVKKALECCATDTCFTNSCPFEDESDSFGILKCTSSLSRIALDLINHQQAEIERLEKLLEEADVNYDKCAKRFYTEAVKEFTSIIESNDYTGGGVHLEVSRDFWDKTKKEMVGDAE